MPIINDKSISRLRSRSEYNLNPYISSIRRLTIDRIFKRGKRLDRSQMPRAKRPNINRIYPYRFYTGELLDSTTLYQPNFNQLELTFEKDEIVLRFLTEKYGQFLGFGEEELNYIRQIAELQNLQRLNNLF